MTVHNITDSAILVNKSRRTIQRYIANGKLMVVYDTLGKPQINIVELIRVFGAISKVSQNRLTKKSQYVAAKKPKKNKSIHLTPDELEDIITCAVEKALSKAIPLLIEHKSKAPIAASISPILPVVHQKRKRIEPISMPVIGKKKARKNGYAVAFGLPSAITEVIHLQIMKLHGQGLTSREIEKKVNISQALIQRTINVST